MTTNREYKDSTFRMLFTIPDNAKALYAWLTGKPWADGEEIFIDEKGGLFTTELNHDVAFRVGNRFIFLIEHQSTDNENMPVRMLIAIAELYKRYLKLRGNAIYRKKLLSLPAIDPYVFYNGKSDESTKREMLLSKAFGVNDTGKLELKVTLININHDKSSELLKSCEPLDGYSRFVYEAEHNRQSMELGAALRKAIEHCRAEGILTDFFAKHEEEVVVSMMMEYNREDELAARGNEEREAGRIEGRIEGRVEGRIEGMLDNIRSLMKTLILSADKAMDALQIPMNDREKYLVAI